MGLLEDLEEASPKVQGLPCTVQRVMEAHPDQADGIWQIVMAGELSGADIARIFGKHGFPIGADAISRHRRNGCACRQRMPERYDS